MSCPERLPQAREAGEPGTMESNRRRVDGSRAVAMTLDHRTRYDEVEGSCYSRQGNLSALSIPDTLAFVGAQPALEPAHPG